MRYEDWSPRIKFKRDLRIKASTWNPVLPCPDLPAISLMDMCSREEFLASGVKALRGGPV